MSGDGTDDLAIPVIFLFNTEGKKFLLALKSHPELEVYIGHTAKTLGEWKMLVCGEVVGLEAQLMRFIDREGRS